MTDTAHHIAWFRHTGPYIKAHRGRTFVIYLGNGALGSAGHATLIHDLALLHSLGIKLVLVHATREAIDAALPTDQQAQFHDGIRITDDLTLSLAIETAARQRVQLEQQLSMGLPNTPLTGARLRILGGNVVTAKPIGIVDAVDYLQSGTVRRVDAEGIRGILDQDAIALLSPLGYSPAGEIFSVSASEVAEKVAVAIGADKLIFLDRQPGLHTAGGELIRQCTIDSAWDLDLGDVEQQRLRDSACRSCASGVARSHLLSYEHEGALLEELFTHDGSGTLIAQNPYEQARSADINDIASIVELIRPLEHSGALVPDALAASPNPQIPPGVPTAPAAPIRSAATGFVCPAWPAAHARRDAQGHNAQSAGELGRWTAPWLAPRPLVSKAVAGCEFLESALRESIADSAQ